MKAKTASALSAMLKAMTILLPKSATPLERFWAKVDKDGPTPEHAPELGPCWIWTSSLDANGYARFSVQGRHVTPHRWIYEQCVGPIPDGLVMDHLCRRPACVNYGHLEPVTHAENCRRGTGIGAGGEIARAAQLKGAATQHRRTMEVTLPAVLEGIRGLIAEGVKPTQRICGARVPGYYTVQRYFAQDRLVEMALSAE